jgi:uncharacterized protein (DUF2225 family)
MPIELTCPCCGNRFESVSLRSTNTCGPLTTDLYRQAGGFQPLPLMVHGCPKCGYAGSLGRFESGSATPELAEWVKANLSPPPDRFASGSMYENSARIAEHMGAGPYEVANIWLRGAWCEPDASSRGARYRREAAVRFEAALDAGQVPQERRAVLTYLIGELHRRTGSPEKAKAWFALVPDAVGGDEKARWLVDLAIQQSTDPKEFVDEGRGR